ncbi:MAG: hypothetical protein DRJ29_09910 [Bacteroidetes bacterium]|nr:MAG: hypothetical protein DRJ29_09910 [Bacteroidota bacterium]
MKIKHLFFFCMLFFSTSLFSQDSIFLDKIKLPSFIDTLFIDRDLNNWSVRLFTNYKNNRFLLNSGDERLAYIPNNPIGVGFGLGTRKIILDIAFNIKSKNEEPTERFDLTVAMMLNHHSIDFFLQSYSGYNFNYQDQEGFRSDISDFASGVDYMYIFNASEYSMAAMKSGLGRQKKSAISFGLGGFLYLTRTSADSSIVPPELYPYFNEESRIVELSGIGTGVHASLNAMVPFLKNFFASASITPGIGLMYKFVETESGSYNPEDPFIYKLDISTMLGYNANKYYINFTLGNVLFRTSLDHSNWVLNNTVKSKLAVGYKFGNR